MTKVKGVLMKLLYIVCWVVLASPLLLVITGNIACICELRFPKIAWEDVPTWLLVTLIAILPTLIVGLTALVQHVRGKPLRKVAVGLIVAVCILLLPVWVFSMILSFMANPFYSHTEDVAHYRQFDGGCYLDNDPYADALLPETVEGADAVYAYRFSGSIYHDVYAAWTLAPEALKAEVVRVDALMAEWGVEPDNCGAFICYNDTYTDWGDRDTLLFAYNPDTGEVRYAACEIYENDIPFYQQQDWSETIQGCADD